MQKTSETPIETTLYKGEIKVKFTPPNHAYYVNGKRKTGVTTFLGIINKPFLIPWAVKETVKFVKLRISDLQNGTEFEIDEILYGAGKEADRQKEHAANIGGQIHDWIELYAKGENPEMPEDPQVLIGVNSFLDWVIEHKVKFVFAEKIVYSKEHDYIGKADLGFTMGDSTDLFLGDNKTGNSLYPEVKAQTAAYLKADEEESGVKYKGRWAIRISKETEEDYIKRMEEKGLTDYPPYKVFEAVYLDSDTEALKRDFAGFLFAQSLYRWQQTADKEMRALKEVVIN
jgi:hypothetical protein